MTRIHNSVLLFLAAALLLGLTAASAFAADYYENVECAGDCSRISILQACRSDNRIPVGFPVLVACDDTANPRAGGVACGGGRCIRFDVNGNHPLSTYCEDRGGADATVVCRVP